MEKDPLTPEERRELASGRRSAFEIVAGMEERRRLRLLADAERARPYVEAAEAKRQRRRERNLRVAGVR